MVERGKTIYVGSTVWCRIVPFKRIYILNVVLRGAVQRLKIELVCEEDCEACGKGPR